MNYIHDYYDKFVITDYPNESTSISVLHYLTQDYCDLEYMIKSTVRKLESNQNYIYIYDLLLYVYKSDILRKLYNYNHHDYFEFLCNNDINGNGHFLYGMYLEPIEREDYIYKAALKKNMFAINIIIEEYNRMNTIKDGYTLNMFLELQQEVTDYYHNFVSKVRMNQIKDYQNYKRSFENDIINVIVTKFQTAQSRIEEMINSAPDEIKAIHGVNVTINERQDYTSKYEKNLLINLGMIIITH